MNPEISDLLKRALALPADERGALANTLLDTLESTNESASIEEAWDAEVARRIEDLKAGKAVTVPWEELPSAPFLRVLCTRVGFHSCLIYHSAPQRLKPI
jgi:putative addiction module component (TIGR02574 family)